MQFKSKFLLSIIASLFLVNTTVSANENNQQKEGGNFTKNLKYDKPQKEEFYIGKNTTTPKQEPNQKQETAKKDVEKDQNKVKVVETKKVEAPKVVENKKIEAPKVSPKEKIVPFKPNVTTFKEKDLNHLVRTKSTPTLEFNNILVESKKIETTVNELVFLKKDLEDKNQKVQKIIKEKDFVIKTLETNNDYLYKEAIGFQNEISNLIKLQNEFHNKISSLEEELNKTLNLKDKEILEINNTKTKELTDIKTTKEKELKDLKEKLESLEKELNKNKLELLENTKTNKIQIDNLKTSVNSLTKENSVLIEENKKIKVFQDENERMKDLIFKRDKKITELEETKTSTNNALVKDLTNEVNFLKNRNMELEILLKNRKEKEIKYQNYQQETRSENNSGYKSERAYKNDDDFIDMKDLDKLFEDINEKN